MGDAEVVVVGAGAAGAVVTRRLAEAGVDVVCLEQGGWPDARDYPGSRDTWELEARGPWDERPNVRHLPADYPIDTRASAMEPMLYNAVGGSTVLWGAQWHRFPPDDFRVRSVDGVADDWPLDYAELAPCYARVERDFAVAALPGNPVYPRGMRRSLPPLPIGVAGRRVAAAHDALGWHWWPGSNAIASRPHGRLHGCVLRGTCGNGCPDGAKASVDVTHWPAALWAGARLVTGARCSGVRVDRRERASGVTWLDPSGVEHFQPASIVVLAANAVGTARLLLLSASPRWPDGVANSTGLVGRRLMMHPFTRVNGLFDEPVGTVAAQWGELVSSLEFAGSVPDRGFVRGAKWNLNPVGGPLAGALYAWPGERRWGVDLHRHVAAWVDRAVAWGVTAEDLPDPENRVDLAPDLRDGHGLPAPRLRYRIDDNARAILGFNVARATESLHAAGAVRTMSLPLMPDFGWHLLGTARMGDDPATSVCDRWGFTHDIPNLAVADGSLFVTSSSVNPTATIAALALRLADRLVEIRRRGAP